MPSHTHHNIARRFLLCLLLLGALLRLFTIQRGIARAGLRFGLKAKVVSMSEGEACIDADKPVDIELIEKIFATRQAAASA